jgi:hypothetical protein
MSMDRKRVTSLWNRLHVVVAGASLLAIVAASRGGMDRLSGGAAKESCAGARVALDRGYGVTIHICGVLTLSGVPVVVAYDLVFHVTPGRWLPAADVCESLGRESRSRAVALTRGAAGRR